MTNLLKGKNPLLFLIAATIIAVSTIYYTNVPAQTSQVQDFKFSATIDCGLNPIEEINANGIKTLSVYDYPVEFLAKSITCDNDGTIVLHDAFLYKYTYRNYRNIGGQPYTKYLDPSEHPENFFETVTISPRSQVAIKENCSK